MKNRPLRSSTLPSAFTTRPLRWLPGPAGVQPFGFKARIAVWLPRAAKTASRLTPSHSRSSEFVSPSPLMSYPVVGVYGRAVDHWTIGATWKPSGRSMTALPTTRCRSSFRVGPNSPSANCCSGVTPTPFPL